VSAAEEVRAGGQAGADRASPAAPAAPAASVAATAAGGEAGVVTRGLALAIDAVLVVVGVVAAVWTVSVIVDLIRLGTPRALHLSPSTWRIIAAAVFWAYNVAGWWLFGRTIGKALLGLKVETVGGGPVPLWRAFVRMVGYLVSLLLLGLGFAIALVTPRRRALHDLLAGTRVVYSDPRG
jgi:uncharacterized RDD family membrane protein YckC